MRVCRRSFPALLAAALVVLPVAIDGQSAKWNPPRTLDGHPDFQGFWTNDSYVPLERPDEVKGKEFFTPDEARAFLKSRVDRLLGQSSQDIHYDDALWQAEPYAKQPTMRTSIIFDPPDGKSPLQDPHKHVVAVHKRPWSIADAPEVKLVRVRSPAWRCPCSQAASA